jgi:hypothetical protein
VTSGATPDGGASAESGEATSPRDAAAPATAAERAFAMLTGRFDSKDQSEHDGEYHAVQLETCEVEAPELGSRVLYVEQALMTKLDAPYRQRLYVVSAEPESEGVVRSSVYELTKPAAAVHLCASPAPRRFAASGAILREGCAVRLAWSAASQSFSGGTEGSACASSLGGAKYATSSVTLRRDGLESWDRGYDEKAVQVWGAAKGPYRFVRRTPLSE